MIRMVLSSRRCARWLLVCLAAGAGLLGQEKPVIGEVRLASVELKELGTEQALIRIQLGAVAKQSAVLRTLVLEDVAINGVPVYLPPVTGKIRIKENEPIADLPAMDAVVAYSGMESLGPLRRIVSEGKARVQARVRAQLQLNPLQKLFLMTDDIWATFDLDHEVEVEIPGGATGKTISVAMLFAAEPVWLAGRAGRSVLRSRHDWRADPDHELAKRILLFETRFQLKSRDGEGAAVSRWSLGFLAGSTGRILATAEAVEPWLFEPEMAEAFSLGEVKAARDLEIVAIIPGSMDQRYATAGKSLRVVKKLSGSERAISAGRKRFDLRLRASDQNAALLEATGLTNASAATLKPLNADSDWTPATIFRVRPDTKNRELESAGIDVRMQDGRIKLRRPVDATSIGSPVWVDGAIAGIVQDTDSAAPAPDVWKRLQ